MSKERDMDKLSAILVELAEEVVEFRYETAAGERNSDVMHGDGKLTK